MGTLKYMSKTYSYRCGEGHLTLQFMNSSNSMKYSVGPLVDYNYSAHRSQATTRAEAYKFKEKVILLIIRIKPLN